VWEKPLNSRKAHKFYKYTRFCCAGLGTKTDSLSIYLCAPFSIVISSLYSPGLSKQMKTYSVEKENPFANKKQLSRVSIYLPVAMETQIINNKRAEDEGRLVIFQLKVRDKLLSSEQKLLRRDPISIMRCHKFASKAPVMRLIYMNFYLNNNST
jgi:hypothetical protein